ncbi:MAG: DUF2339 domain-containing protein [Planctomycetaceae bacterium]
MGSGELVIVLMIGGLLLIVPLIAIVLSIVAISKTRQLTRLAARLDGIEACLRNAAKQASVTRPDRASEIPVATPSPVTAQSVVVPAVTDAQRQTATMVPLPAGTTPQTISAEAAATPPIGWETFIGQKAFGWLAVVLFLFSATFFLRYAYQNNWIGPVGRVAIGELVGSGLVIAGARYLLNGWRRFATMLISTGIVVIYLATYSAFGFYNLLPQQHAGFFLAILILESMVAAVFCRSAVIGMMAVIGGVLTPILMQADHDTYSSFFSYLAVLNFGVVVASYFQRWRAVGSVAYGGTQLLFWMWYEGNYHPEKMVWALGFQMVIFALWLSQSLVAAVHQQRTADYEELGRYVINAILGGDVELWRWRAQLALTVFWTLFAIGLMWLGFRLSRSRLRWFSMVLFGITVLKLFVVDMASVQQIYRIVAFFILAMVLGLVARTYQRFK